MSTLDGFKQVTLRITGICPLIVHNGQLADPRNPFSKDIKAISGTRKKVDADLEEMARLEFLGGLYILDGRPCVPCEALEAMMINGAKKQRKGMDFQSGMVIEDWPYIEYDGPTSPEAMWESKKFRFSVPAKIGKVKVVRTRPKFDEWALQFTVHYIDELINERDILETAVIAGWQIGLCEWRPRFGRFTVKTVPQAA